MRDLNSNLTQNLEKLPGVSMRMAPDNGGLKLSFVTANVERYGYSQQSIINGDSGWETLIHPEDRAGILENLNQNLGNGTPRFKLQYRILTADGVMYPVKHLFYVIRKPNGSIRCVDSMIFMDAEGSGEVWSDTRIEQQLVLNDLLLSLAVSAPQPDLAPAFSQQTFETVLDNVDSYIFVSDQHSGKIIFANQSFRSLFGSACLGQNYAELLSLGPEQESERARVKPGQESLVAYETYLDKTGQWLSVTRSQIPWMDGIQAHLFNCNDITFKKNYEDSIKRLAYLDHLTGLPNRYRCDTDIRKIMSSARRHQKRGYLLFIDLDDFKIVNDTFGHHYGDAVLVNFAAYLNENFAGTHNVYRFGGDEFVLVIMDCEKNCIEEELAALLERAKLPWKALNREFYCSLSIGVVEISPDNSDPKTILRQADIAMYQAKKEGKNKYVFYTEGLDNATIERSEMEWLLREAMNNDFQGFEIYYQPYSRTSDSQILGAEALVRMHGRDGELLLPKTFVPLAEYLGLIIPLGEHVLRIAAMQCKAVNDAGRPDFSMTVNLSAKQFQQPDIVERLETIMRSTGVNFENMIISVNEGVALNVLERMLQICRKFRKHGIRVALDDFGSGNSSLINMRDLPVDIIKVSSTFIDDYQDKYSGYFIRLVTDLGHFSGKLVCMNGVETQEHYEFCKELGLDMVQGFLLHRPDSVEALEALLRRQPKEQSF